MKPEHLFPDYWFWRVYYLVYFWVLFNVLWPLGIKLPRKENPSE